MHEQLIKSLDSVAVDISKMITQLQKDKKIKTEMPSSPSLMNPSDFIKGPLQGQDMKDKDLKPEQAEEREQYFAINNKIKSFTKRINESISE